MLEYNNIRYMKISYNNNYNKDKEFDFYKISYFL